MIETLRKIDRALFPDLLVRGIARELAGMESVLDVGCGKGGPLLAVPKPPRLVGADGHQPSLDRLRETGHYDELVFGSLDSVVFSSRSFDVVMCLDVIEHFEKAEACRLIERLEGWAVKKVILTTPNGFTPQPVHDGNPFQEHKCGFEAGELRARGYRVRGFGGPRPLRETFGELRFRPQLLWFRVSRALQPLTWFWAEAASGLVAVKEME